jgi:hypothetical protein
MFPNVNNTIDDMYDKGSLVFDRKKDTGWVGGESSVYDTGIKKHKITMIDHINKKTLPRGLNCFWCRHSFDNEPSGCPIRYVPCKIETTHKSDVTKDTYTVTQSVPSFIHVHLPPSSAESYTLGYYETDGIFCSFGCRYAYIIHEKKTNKLYSESEYLLKKIFIETYGETNIFELVPAPSWKLLKPYGGSFTIEQFRDLLWDYVFEEKSTSIRHILEVHPIGTIFDERYTL